jgi:hypothetical protein
MEYWSDGVMGVMCKFDYEGDFEGAGSLGGSGFEFCSGGRAGAGGDEAGTGGWRVGSGGGREVPQFWHHRSGRVVRAWTVRNSRRWFREAWTPALPHTADWGQVMEAGCKRDFQEARRAWLGL